jgi:hypothetical protein
VLEKDLERECVKLARAFGCRLHKWLAPGITGLPDRILLIPGGRLHFIEFKRPDGKGILSEQQKTRIQELRSMGFSVDVVASKERFYQILSEYHDAEDHRPINETDAEAVSTAAYHAPVRTR